MTFKLPTIYPITDRQISGLSHLEQAKRFVRGGSRFIQLREKDLGSHEFYDAAAKTVEFASTSGTTIIINDRVDIAIAAGAAGVHLGQDDMPPEKVRALLGDKAVIGYSTHTIEQAKSAAVLPVDYIAIGPIFHTNTKADADAVVGLDGIRRVRDVIGELPLVAIGGININEIASVLEAGADSVAMIGAILGNGDIDLQIKSLIARFSKHSA